MSTHQDTLLCDNKLAYTFVVHVQTIVIIHSLAPYPDHLLCRGKPELWVDAPLSAPMGPAGDNTLVTLGGAGTKGKLGKPKDFPSFGWDNEYGECVLEVPEFEVSKFLVTNREYLEFVRSGGCVVSPHVLSWQLAHTVPQCKPLSEYMGIPPTMQCYLKHLSMGNKFPMAICRARLTSRDFLALRRHASHTYCVPSPPLQLSL